MNVIVVGATGYSGLELIKTLIQHPKVNIYKLFGHQTEYNSIVDVYPHLKSFIDIPLEILDDVDDVKLKEMRKNADVVFLATPSGVSTKIGPMFLKHGFKVIDLSGDFRLNDADIYKKWYLLDAPSDDLLNQAVYGLPEWFSDEIKTANYLANPGCNATGVILGIAPLFSNHISINGVIADVKSGVSGAGRGTNRATHFSQVNENIKAYKIGQHKHIPEIEQIISTLDGKTHTIQLIPHLVPMTKGILSTIYIDLAKDTSYEEIYDIYEKAYSEQPFIRLCKEGDFPETKHVTGTNLCDIGIYFDQRTKKLIIVTAIDNLLKGASGQAIQNLNIMMGWDQKLGLSFVPTFP